MGGSGFLCPQAWMECSWAEAAGAGELCLSLPPPPSFPAQSVPFSFSPRSPPHPLLFRALHHHSFPSGLCPPSLFRTTVPLPPPFVNLQ